MWNQQNRSHRSAIALFLAGVGTGGLLALLFAPQSGKESQEWIANDVREGLSQAKAMGQDLRERAEDWGSRGKKKASEAVQMGKDAYREATENA